MGRIVDGKTEADDENDSDNTVHGEVPEANQAKKEDIDEDDGQDDEQSDRHATRDEHDDEEDCKE